MFDFIDVYGSYIIVYILGLVSGVACAVLWGEKKKLWSIILFVYLFIVLLIDIINYT